MNIPVLGATVAVIGTGESATPAALESVRGLPTIVANAAVRLKPDADILVSIDANWPPEGDAFEGLRIVGVPTEREAQRIGVPYEVVRMSPYETLHILNNGLLAIRIAAAAGAKRIVLVGFDPPAYDAHQLATGYAWRGMVEGLAQLKAELAATGVVVEHARVAVEVTPIDKPPRGRSAR